MSGYADSFYLLINKGCGLGKNQEATHLSVNLLAC